MPLEELPLVLARSGAQGIVLSGSNATSCDSLQSGICSLMKAVSVPVFVGGEVAGRCREQIEGCGAIAVGPDSFAGMEVIRKQLARFQPAQVKV
jgi:hypothetical protein